MSKPKLIYFDAPVSRGEECRLALQIAGVEFEDVRLSREEWAARKPTSPFGAVPYFEVPGQPPLGQTNAILTLIGRRHGLHPKDDFEAARHEAFMNHVEDLRAQLGATMRIADADQKKRTREELAATYIPAWGAFAERQISEDGPFFAGNNVHVVDVKILMIVRWLKSGALDHVPSTVFADFRKLNRVHDAVDAHPAVRAWYAKK